MRIAAQPISHHRLQRFHRWAMLWLTWFAALLEAADDFAPLTQTIEKRAHRWLDQIEQLIVSIVALRAVPQMRGAQLRKRVFRRHLGGGGCGRAFVGARMRRALRSKHLHQRIQALREDVDALVARVLRRLPRGLTRRRPILARPESRGADVRAIFHAPALCADTS